MALWVEVHLTDCLTGVDGETGVARIASAKAGSTIVFEWRDWPDGSQPGSIDISHKGPCAVYMKKVDNSAASNNAAGDGWFKIMEDGYDSAAGKWCTEKLVPADGHLAANIPKDLAPGYYLMRPELLALHQADKTPPDPQFYVGCAQIALTTGGSATPAVTVAIPGYVNLSTPAMTFNIWQVPMKLPFPEFGPPVYTGGSSKRDLEPRGSFVQTIGLTPPDCVMQNGNWCGFMPPKYTDQNGCYAVSQSSLHLFQFTYILESHHKIALHRPPHATTRPAQPEARIATTSKPSALRSGTPANPATTMVLHRPLLQLPYQG